MQCDIGWAGGTTQTGESKTPFHEVVMTSYNPHGQSAGYPAAKESSVVVTRPNCAGADPVVTSSQIRRT